MNEGAGAPLLVLLFVSTGSKEGLGVPRTTTEITRKRYMRANVRVVRSLWEGPVYETPPSMPVASWGPTWEKCGSSWLVPLVIWGSIR